MVSPSDPGRYGMIVIEPSILSSGSTGLGEQAREPEAPI
jgi:hypothetical protein